MTCFNPYNVLDWPSVGRPAGRPVQKSVDRTVDRCAQTCTAQGRSTARELLLSGNSPVDRAVDRWAIALKPVDRPVDWPSQRSKNRPLAVDQAVDRQQCRLLIWTPAASFLMPINWGSHGLFYTRFEVGFWASFFYSIKCLSSLVLEPNTSIQKESLSRVFKSDFLYFPPQIQSLFFSHILELSIDISIL